MTAHAPLTRPLAIDDRQGRTLSRVGAFRDDIDARVRGLLAELGAHAPA